MEELEALCKKTAAAAACLEGESAHKADLLCCSQGYRALSPAMERWVRISDPLAEARIQPPRRTGSRAFMSAHDAMAAENRRFDQQIHALHCNDGRRLLLVRTRVSCR